MSNRRDEPSFFKALVGDFRHKLCLPKALRMKLSDEGKILLTNPNTRRSWSVSVKEDENDLFLCNEAEPRLVMLGRMTRLTLAKKLVSLPIDHCVIRQSLMTLLKKTPGSAPYEWTNFADDNDLQFAEFLVFRSSGGLKFTVKIFGRNGCEKEFPSSMENNEESPDVVMTNTGSQVDETWRSLTPTFLRTSRYNFYVPRWWAKVTSLGAKDRITLLDPSDKLWPVNIYHGEAGRTFLGTGWFDFSEDNGLETGDTLRLQFVDKDVIRTDIIQRKVDSTDITTEQADADLSFNVEIFDKTARKKEYDYMMWKTMQNFSTHLLERRQRPQLNPCHFQDVQEVDLAKVRYHFQILRKECKEGYHQLKISYR